QFARTMLKVAPDKKVARADLLCTFHGWLKEEAGDDSKLHGARWFVPKLRMACPQAVSHPIEGKRYFCGIMLTEEALEYWTRQAFNAQQTGRGSQGVSATKDKVNQPWNPDEIAQTEIPY